MTCQPIDFSQWKCTLPVGKPGHPLELVPPTSSYAPWYRRVADELLFRAHAGGVTTSGSSYPRCELRELIRGTDDPAGWDSRSGLHLMKLDARVTHLPAVHPNLVPLQIHNGADDVMQVRLEGRRLFVECDGDEVGVLDASHRRGSRFQLRVATSRSGIEVSYLNDERPLGVLLSIPGLAGGGWFWKAGCYLQTNVAKGDNAEDYGEVAVRSARTLAVAA